MTEKHRFQHFLGEIEHVEPGTARHAELMDSDQWQKAPLSSVSGEELADEPQPAEEQAAKRRPNTKKDEGE